MKIQLQITTEETVNTTVTVEVSAKAYAYAEQVLLRALMDIFREEANGLPHAGKKETTP